MEDSVSRIESRQISDDEYELRSPTHTTKIYAVGYRYFLDRFDNPKKWNTYLKYNPPSVPRKDI